MIAQQRPSRTIERPDARPPAGFTTNIEAIKGGVPIEEYAATLTTLRRAGDKLVGLCPLPDHDEKTPSFCVYPEGQHYHCYGCQGHGDLLDLHQAVTGDGLPEALVELSTRYGVELPGRPEAWHEKNRRQQPVRDAIGRVKAQVLRRRIFRACILPAITATISEPTEHDAEVQRAWTAFASISDAALVAWYEGKRGKHDAS